MSDAVGSGGFEFCDEAPQGDWDECGPSPEQRATPRFTLLIRTAKLITSAGEFLCIVRDASSDGLKVRLFHPLPGDRRLEIELANGERQTIDKVWERGDAAGFRFAGPVAIERLLADAPDGMQKRSVRLRLAVPAVVAAGERRLAVTLRDISQHGACLACDDLLAINQRVRIVCEAFPERTARVRWRRRPLHGLIFEQPFRFDELALLTAPLQAAA